MIVCKAAVSVLFHECQIVTVLPGGGGASGALGGSSVGVSPGVPLVGAGRMGAAVPGEALGVVADPAGVVLGGRVDVGNPGYGVAMLPPGPGYCDVIVG